MFFVRKEYRAWHRLGVNIGQLTFVASRPGNNSTRESLVYPTECCWEPVLVLSWTLLVGRY